MPGPVLRPEERNEQHKGPTFPPTPQSFIYSLIHSLFIEHQQTFIDHLLYTKPRSGNWETNKRDISLFIHSLPHSFIPLNVHQKREWRSSTVLCDRDTKTQHGHCSQAQPALMSSFSSVQWALIERLFCVRISLRQNLCLSLTGSAHKQILGTHQMSDPGRRMKEPQGSPGGTECPVFAQGE